MVFVLIKKISASKNINNKILRRISGSRKNEQRSEEGRSNKFLQ
jgi:hypothetical protein